MIKFYFVKIFRKLFMGAAVRKSEIHKTAKVDVLCNVSYSKMGKYSYVGEKSGISHAQIGNFVSISSNCVIGGGGHPIDWVSSSPVFNDHMSILHVQFSKNPYEPHKTTIIDHDVWIGTHCLIKSGVHIHTGAVIGMGSVVTKDVGPYEVWVGNPARCIKKRFDDETIEKLLKSEWYLWEDDKIKENADLFATPEAFLEKFCKEESV